jgi:hypothetical protein
MIVAASTAKQHDALRDAKGYKSGHDHRIGIESPPKRPAKAQSVVAESISDSVFISYNFIIELSTPPSRPGAASQITWIEYLVLQVSVINMPRDW